MDRVVCSPEEGAGSGSGSGGWICKGSTPDLTVINKAFVHPRPSNTLPQVFTTPHKRHTLLSPLPSRPGTPSPLRISTHTTTPTLTLTPATATAHLPPDSLLFDTTMPIHQPRPQHASLSPVISPSDSQLQHRPVTPSRPSSRSEKLLRETLMRDQDRPPVPTSPYSPSAGRSPNPRHRRRHSELPPMHPSGRTRSQEEERAEELARGSMMFRSPMMAAGPRSPSPYAAHDSPTMSRRHSQTQHQHHHHHHGAASQHSHSPTRSPMLGRRSSIKSQQSSSQQQQRHASPGISRQRVPHPLPLGPESHYQADPAVMTPHEQVLRARLERVLQSGKVVGSPKRDVYYEDWKREDSSPPADDEQESSSSEDIDEDENVVRDENGTRAWRRDTHPPASSRRAPVVSGMLSPSTSTSGSGSARSDSQDRLQQRSRSSTEPNFPVMQQPTSPYPSHPTPRRSTTAPNGAALKRQPQPQHHHRGRHAPSGTTPPLVSDGSPTPPEDDEEDRESDELRLLTPPSTPPSHLATYNHQALAAAYGYAPSPYYTKTAFSATERRGRTLQGRGRPPLRGIGPAVYDEDEDDDEEDSVSGGSSYYEEGEGYYCSSGSCSSCSGSGCSSCVRYIHKQLPTNPMQHTLPPRHQLQQLQQQQRQQFNVRRASARCREMDGYISFAAVEGLGAPPESESGEEAASENAQKEAAAKKGGVGGWVRRLWGSEGNPGAVVV